MASVKWKLRVVYLYVTSCFQPSEGLRRLWDTGYGSIHPCACLLCLPTAARATQLLVIGCVGSIMELGGVRRQRRVKQNAASCASPGTLYFLRSPLCLPQTPQSCQKASKVEAMQYHTAPLRSAWREMSLTVFSLTVLFTSQKAIVLSQTRAEERSVITYLITVTTCMSQE